MSAVSTEALSSHGGRPPLRRLLGATSAAQLLGWGLAFSVVVIFSAVRIEPVAGLGRAIYLPWRVVDGWSAVAAAGWAIVASAGLGWLTALWAVRRGLARPAVLWCAVVMWLAGYVGLRLGHTAWGKLGIAVVLEPILLSAVAYGSDGSARSGPPVPRRAWTVGLVVAALVGLSYSVLHCVTVNGGSGAYLDRPGTIASLAPGGRLVVGVTIAGPLFTTTVTSLRFEGTNADVVTARLVTRRIAPDRPVITLHPISLPLSLSDDFHGLTFALRLRFCPTPWIVLRRLRVSYTVLGIATTAEATLTRPIRITCP